jgi:hypothetical protein
MSIALGLNSRHHSTRHGDRVSAGGIANHRDRVLQVLLSRVHAITKVRGHHECAKEGAVAMGEGGLASYRNVAKLERRDVRPEVILSDSEESLHTHSER